MTATIESIFLGAVKRGPVLVIDNMADPTHAATDDPITTRSPLIRLAILAVDLGADPSKLVFKSEALFEGGGFAKGALASLYAMHDCPELNRLLMTDVPALGFHWCELNRMWFVGEFVHNRQRLKADRPKDGNEHVREAVIWVEPLAAQVDLNNPKHVQALESVMGYFARKGWVSAVKRLAKCMEPGPALATPIKLGPGVDARLSENGTLTVTSTRDGGAPPVDLRSADPHPFVAAYTPPTDRTAKTLRGELREALNRCSAENGSNTPDFILAELLVGSLAAFNHAVAERDRLRERDKEAVTMLGKEGAESSKRHREVTGKQWTEISDLLRERKLDVLLPFAERTLPKMVAAALDMMQKRGEMAASDAAHWQARAETAEKMLVTRDPANLTGYEKDLVEDAEKRARTAEDESKIWHERWQAHNAAISEITRAYFEAGLGPTPTNPTAIASALRLAAGLRADLVTQRKRAEAAENQLSELAAADKEDHILRG